MCSYVCMCVLEVALFSFSCVFISKQILSVRGEVILEMPAVQRECLICCSSSLCSLFPIAEMCPLACRVLPRALAACREYGRPKCGWLCGPRATASHFVLASLHGNILLASTQGLK